VASATDVGRFETFLGYNFVRFNPNSDFIPSFNAHGGGGQFVYNFNDWIGGVFDLGAVNSGTLNGFIPPVFTANPNNPVSARLQASNTGFAMMAGGGLDIRLSKHVAVRPVGADYYLTRVSSLLTGGTTNRNNFRYSAGINFLFGAR